VAVHVVGDRISRPATVDERAGWPIVDVVDRTQDERWHTSLVTSALIRQLRDPDRVVVCVHNVRGRARLLACRSCRAVLRCESCAASVEQGDDGRLGCRRCGAVRPLVCQVCGASAPVVVRPGVTRLRDELEAAAARPVVAVTGADTSHDVLPEAGVYIGTEAVLHRVRRADTVAFLDLDTELLAPRYRAGEQALGLLVRAARLVGPRSGGGRLLLQTAVPGHEVVRAALFADPDRLTRHDLGIRRTLGFPPFGALAVVDGAGAAALSADLRTAGLAVAPQPDASLLVRGADPDVLASALRQVVGAGTRTAGQRVRIRIDPPRV
jgi:primosomal protein N' (replication factor Y)